MPRRGTVLEVMKDRGHGLECLGRVVFVLPVAGERGGKLRVVPEAGMEDELSQIVSESRPINCTAEQWVDYALFAFTGPRVLVREMKNPAEQPHTSSAGPEQ